MTRSVRRAVFERDGEQCAFVDESGRRCESRAFLELDHLIPRARGGPDDVSHIVVCCRSHNGLAAERDFGREHIERKKAESQNRPRQRGHAFEIALRALTAMGFKEQRARHAVRFIEERKADPDPSIERILRETLTLLT